MKTIKFRRLGLLSAALLMVGSIGYAVSAQSSPIQGDRIAQSSPTDASPNSSEGQRQSGRRPRIDFAAAATQLGTTEAELKEALGLPAQPPEGDRPERMRPNLQEAATTLGVTEDQLLQALGITIDPATGRPSRSGERPDLQAAATQLGVTEEQLKAALGHPGQRANGDRPEGRPRMDIPGAAAKLGVTEDQLIQALGLPDRRERPPVDPMNEPSDSP